MKTYMVKKSGGKIDWNKIDSVRLEPVLIAGDADINAEWQLCYDDEYLYVHMHAAEEDVRAFYMC